MAPVRFFLTTCPPRGPPARDHYRQRPPPPPAPNTSPAARTNIKVHPDPSVRSAATCMVVSKVGGLATSLCRARRSLSRRPWDLSPHTPCRSPGALTRVAARTLARSPIRDQLHRRLQPFRHLHDCSGCFRLERSPGGACTHWKAPPSHGAHVKRTLRIVQSATLCARWGCRASNGICTKWRPSCGDGEECWG